MTDKEKIRGRIEKWLNICLERAKIVDADYWNGKADAYRNVLLAFDDLHEEPAGKVSEELEKTAEGYAKYTAAPQSDVAYYFVSGAQWQKQQMMKDAIEGVYDCDDDNSWIEFKGWAESTSKAGCKVKVIIIKENEK